MATAAAAAIAAFSHVHCGFNPSLIILRWQRRLAHPNRDWSMLLRSFRPPCHVSIIVAAMSSNKNVPLSAQGSSTNTTAAAATTIPWTVETLSTQLFIQQALEQARNRSANSIGGGGGDGRHPQAVLSFFYGVDWHSQESIQSELRQGQCLRNMFSLWFASNPVEYDALCQPFTAWVEDAGSGSLIQDHPYAWSDTVDGLVARILLCDQLPRNIFRGTAKAFAYDDVAVPLARRLAQCAMQQHQRQSKNASNHDDKASDSTDDGSCSESDSFKAINGEIYPSYLFHIVLALMHSEDLADHELADVVLDYAIETTMPSLEHMQNTWHGQKLHVAQHKEVIKRFGRYPHRNILKGRANTPDEDAWLADVNNLPGWAKSQMKK